MSHLRKARAMGRVRPRACGADCVERTNRGRPQHGTVAERRWPDGDYFFKLPARAGNCSSVPARLPRGFRDFLGDKSPGLRRASRQEPRREVAGAALGFSFFDFLISFF